MPSISLSFEVNPFLARKNLPHISSFIVHECYGSAIAIAMLAEVASIAGRRRGLSGTAMRKEPFFVSRAERRRVIVASSIGTVFEWYDFYLYAVLAPFFAKLFFPPENETAALLAAFATYAAGFIVRPFGGVFFGRLGDLTGRKYTFLISIIFMGFSTFIVGLLPTFEQVGWLAPILLLTLRLLQGLALGGEYGGRRLTLQNTIRQQCAVTPQAGFKRRRRSASFFRSSSCTDCYRRLPLADTKRRFRALWLADPFPFLDLSSGFFDLYPHHIAGDACFSAHEVRGALLQDPGLGKLFQMAEQ